jgi:hypothetical protein
MNAEPIWRPGSLPGCQIDGAMPGAGQRCGPVTGWSRPGGCPEPQARLMPTGGDDAAQKPAQDGRDFPQDGGHELGAGSPSRQKGHHGPRGVPGLGRDETMIAPWGWRIRFAATLDLAEALAGLAWPLGLQKGLKATTVSQGGHDDGHPTKVGLSPPGRWRSAPCPGVRLHPGRRRCGCRWPCQFIGPKRSMV